MFSLDVFSIFLGQPRTECKFSGGGGASAEAAEEQAVDHTPRRGEEEYIYIRSRNGGGEGGGQVTSIEMYFDLVSLAHSHPPSHNISSTSIEIYLSHIF